MGIPPFEFLLYYAGGTLLVLLLLFWKRPRRGMRLRLSRGPGSYNSKKTQLDGRAPPAPQNLRTPSVTGAERSVNVVFNYNGHSWDAYEVLGLPAGSGMAVVEAAYKESLERVEASSRPFMEAAYRAIQESHASRRASG